MIKYQYQIIRYVHDQFSQEFGNIGIVLFSPDRKFLNCKVITKFSRLSGFFGEINGYFLINSLKHFELRISQIAKELPDGLNITEITKSILPKDDSALILTDTFYGVDLAPEIALYDLFERIVDKYSKDNYSEKHTDSYVWKNIYKTYFDKLGITQNLKKHTVETGKDKINFDRAWKNGVWNCYQSLSFDLKNDDSIKSKVYKWSGIIRELESSHEQLKLYFLTTAPQAEHANLKSFIDETLSLDKETIKVRIIEEKDAEKFAEKVRADMEKSNAL